MQSVLRLGGVVGRWDDAVGVHATILEGPKSWQSRREWTENGDEGERLWV